MNSAQRLLVAAGHEDKIRDAGATKSKLLKAALAAFSSRGYDAASTRSIETSAGVKRGLINHHYGSKRALWEAAADYIMSIAERDVGTALEGIERMEKPARLRFFVRAYVIFCASHPELNRLMIQEGMRQDWRLNWLLERSVRPWYTQVCSLFNAAKKLGGAPNMSAHHFYYILTGAATLIFANAAEAEALSGRNPLDTASIEAHADALADLFTSLGSSL